jgi:isopentenyldiphosphate isomerase
MEELFDIYDANRNFLGKSEKRDKYHFKAGEYHIVTDAFIFNSNGQLLLTRRSPNKKGGLLWEGTGGSVLAGEKSEDAILREIREELGLQIKKEEIILFKSIRKDEEKSPRFKDLWILKKDIKISDLILQEEEVVDAKWVYIEEFKKMMHDKEIVSSLDFNENDFEEAISILNRK